MTLNPIRKQKKNEQGDAELNGENPAREESRSLWSFQPVEQIPTVMLEGSGSFLGDMINMAKFTRKLCKRKK